MKKLILAVTIFLAFCGSLLGQVDLNLGLIAYYPFNGNANDESGNGNNGIVFGAALAVDRFGRENSLYSFDGMDDYIEISNENNFDLSEFTLAAIIKVPNYQKDNWIISKGFYFGNFTLQINDDQGFWPGYASYVHQTNIGNWSSLVSNTEVPINVFFHIAVTISPKEFRAYINGEVTRVVSNPASPMVNNEHVLIGAGGYYSISDFFVGIIDDIRIYNRDLTEVEIQELYRKSTLPPINTAVIVHGYPSIPQAFALHQNHPNPFNPITVIRYELPVAGKATLKIYNLLGTEVMTLENDEPREPGYYEKVVDLRSFASGIYFYRISVSGEKRFEITKKMALVK